MNNTGAVMITQAAVVFLYLCLAVAVGVRAQKKTHTPGGFDGEKLGILFCVAAGAGEWLGGSSTTGVSEYGFEYGISGAWYTLANSIGICVLAVFFGGMFRRTGQMTVPGIIGVWLGERTRKVASFLLLIVMVMVGISQMVAVGSLGEALFHISTPVSILVFGAVALAYTLLGGMVAVGYTNTIHIVVMYVGMVAAVAYCLTGIGGMEKLHAGLDASYFSFAGIGFPKVSSWALASVFGACTAQAGLQPVLAAKDERTAVRSSYLIAALVMPFGILTAILGMIARVKFPELTNAKLALPNLLLTLPPALGGVVFAAVFAAVLSTAAPVFLACGTLFTRDLYQGKNKPESKSEALNVSRYATAVFGILCILAAVLLGHTQRVLDIVYFAYSIRGSLFVILLFGIYWKKTSPGAANAAMLCAAGCGFFWAVYKNITGSYPVHPYLSETYIAVLVSMAVTVMGSLVGRKGHKNGKNNC